MTDEELQEMIGKYARTYDQILFFLHASLVSTSGFFLHPLYCLYFILIVFYLIDRITTY